MYSETCCAQVCTRTVGGIWGLHGSVTPRSIGKASTRKTATTEFGREAVLIFTLLLRGSDRVSDDYYENNAYINVIKVFDRLASRAKILVPSRFEARERELSAKR